MGRVMRDAAAGHLNPILKKQARTNTRHVKCHVRKDRGVHARYNVSDVMQR